MKTTTTKIILVSVIALLSAAINNAISGYNTSISGLIGSALAYVILPVAIGFVFGKRYWTAVITMQLVMAFFIFYGTYHTTGFTM